MASDNGRRQQREQQNGLRLGGRLGDNDDDDEMTDLASTEELLPTGSNTQQRHQRKRKRRCASWLRTGFFYMFVLAGFLTLLMLWKISLVDAFTKAKEPAGEGHTEPEIVSPSLPPPPPPSSSSPPPPPPPPPSSSPSPPSPSSSPPSFRRPDADFVLDPDWDYHAPPTTRTYHWTIQNIEANPDGVFRTMTTVNDKYPGELIRCNEGDTIVVEVENQAVNATSLHWHGLFQNGTNHMDGTPGTTQCAIAPGKSFRYEFEVKGQAGTYFYHGHQGAEALDGLVGPFVIHSPAEIEHQPIAYASDRIVLVQDWYHDLSSELLMQALAPGSESSPLPNGALINGANVVDCDGYPDRRCDNATARIPRIDLERGQNHRLRFINAGGFAWLEVTLDGHQQLPVTEVDGVTVEPAAERSLLMAPGQRYSVVLAANATEEGNNKNGFWLRTRIATHCFAEYTLAGQDNPVALAAVRYVSGKRENERSEEEKESERSEEEKENERSEERKCEEEKENERSEERKSEEKEKLPTSEYDGGLPTVVCRDMRSGFSSSPYRPVPAQMAPVWADRSYHLRVNLAIGNWRLQRGVFNESSFRPNLTSPALHRLVDGLHRTKESYSAFREDGVSPAFDALSELTLAHTGIQTIDLILQNMDEGSHPLHLHGHQMFVLGADHGYFPGYEALGFQPEGRGLLDPQNTTLIANPPRRDVATVEGFGWALVRVVLDNPGVWRFHCHMIWHGDGGMGLHLVDRTDVLADLDIPEANKDLCAATADELEMGGAPKDEIWYGYGVDG